MAEQDLGAIVAQVQALRQLDASAQQTEAAYRATIINHTQGLLAICNQPDIHTLIITQGNLSTISIPGRITDLANKKVSFQFVDNQKGVSFAICVGSPAADELSYQTLSGWEVANGRPPKKRLDRIYSNEQLEGDNLEKNHNLDRYTQWVWVEDVYSSTHYLIKELTPDDFVRHPEWLAAFDIAVMNRLIEAQGQLQSTAQGQQERITQFQSAPLARVIAELQRNPHAYSPTQLHEIAQDAAETVVENPTLAVPGVSENQVRRIVGEMLEQRLAALQVAPDRRIVSTISPRDEQRINQAARGDATTESMFRRFVRRSRDPERAVQSLVELTAFFPGAAQLQAVLRVLNLYFGPEETTR